MPSLGLIAKIALLALTSLVLGYVIADWSQFGKQQQAIAAHAEEIFRSPTSFVAGNPQGDVSVVAFFDYNCPDCRRTAPDLARVIAQEPNIRVVLKELPVLGADSEAVARLALAAKAQGKYAELHDRLITERGRATVARALSVASELGLDPDALKTAAEQPSITAALAENKRLAGALRVKGVPFYLVGDRVLGEGSDPFYPELEAAVAKVRKDGCAACR